LKSEVFGESAVTRYHIGLSFSVLSLFPEQLFPLRNWNFHLQQRKCFWTVNTSNPPHTLSGLEPTLSQRDAPPFNQLSFLMIILLPTV